jgi:hypothetical protein
MSPATRVFALMVNHLVEMAQRPTVMPARMGRPRKIIDDHLPDHIHLFSQSVFARVQ